VTLNGHSHVLGRFEFRGKFFRRVFADRRKQIAVHTPEAATDFLLILYLFDAVHGGGLTFVEDLRTVFTMALDERFEAVVTLRSEMCRGPRAHSAAFCPRRASS
jgi:hypothetical protein